MSSHCQPLCMDVWVTWQGYVWVTWQGYVQGDVRQGYVQGLGWSSLSFGRPLLPPTLPLRSWGALCAAMRAVVPASCRFPAR